MFGFKSGKNQQSSSQVNLNSQSDIGLEGNTSANNSKNKEKHNNSGGNLCIQKEKTKVIKKGYTEFNNLLVAQEIQCGNDAIWVIRFRTDGVYMAVVGNDGILRIFKCIEGTDESKLFKNLIVIDPRQTLSSEPVREYKNSCHSKDIFDIRWGTSSPSSTIILTASSDFTVFIYDIKASG